ncbi:hypothetical protein FACS189459_5640 [Bacilli bacterium]|nr:hypothetical protein FACS189459_5640 [Bacilli bacterium]
MYVIGNGPNNSIFNESVQDKHDLQPYLMKQQPDSQRVRIYPDVPLDPKDPDGAKIPYAGIFADYMPTNYITTNLGANAASGYYSFNQPEDTNTMANAVSVDNIKQFDYG